MKAFVAIVVVASCLLVPSPPHVEAVTEKVPERKFEDQRFFGGKYSFRQIFKLIREDCGEVCDVDVEGTPGKYYDVIKKEVDCDGLFRSPYVEWSSDVSPPFGLFDLPEDVVDLFSHGGRIAVQPLFMDDVHLPQEKMQRHKIDREKHKLFWGEHHIELMREQLRERKMGGFYGPETSNEVSDSVGSHLADRVAGKSVLVVGSTYPWVEAILLEHGAESVTTLDFINIHCTHPNVTTMTPAELRANYLKTGELPQFDAVVSFSSLEHSGLGRYGDGLNPWGDMVASAKAWCLTKEGGRALYGVPAGYDGVLFNGCRMYGPVLLSHLFANWDQVHTEARMYPKGKDTPKEKWFKKGNVWDYQPLFVLEKPKQKGEEGKTEL